jgi:5-methylcytosine-specific restriction endonuclease McrA
MPLMPCSEMRARLLLARGRARVHRVMLFVIRLTDRRAEECEFQSLRLKLDPGSKVTGMALVREYDDGAAIVNLFELVHRGRQISEALAQRRAFRRRRRGANLRYRAPRFNNRTRDAGWLAPSLRHRVDTTMAWVTRLMRWAPVSALSVELVCFDMQAMQNPEISGVEYQQGELAGYEVREYLLEKWGRTCAYCDGHDVPLQIEHIVAKARGGSNRVSNLTLACEPCNRKKDARDVREFVKDKARLTRILATAKAPLRDAAAVNSTRWALLIALKTTGLHVETGSGGRTKWNRTRLKLPKTQALDAACVGLVDAISGWPRPTLEITCNGRGSYQRTRLTAQGFPRGYLTRQKRVHGFQTGDRVRAAVPAGRKAGAHIGRVAVRATGSFNIQTPNGVIQGIAHRHCTLVQRADGYGYSIVPSREERESGAGTTARRAPHAALSLLGMNAEVSRATG